MGGADGRQSHGRRGTKPTALTEGIFLILIFSLPSDFAMDGIFSAMKMERISNRQECASSLARPEVSAHCP